MKKCAGVSLRQCFLYRKFVGLARKKKIYGRENDYFIIR